MELVFFFLYDFFFNYKGHRLIVENLQDRAQERNISTVTLLMFPFSLTYTALYIRDDTWYVILYTVSFIYHYLYSKFFLKLSLIIA